MAHLGSTIWNRCAPPRETMVRFLKSHFVRWSTAGLAITVILLALFYAEENWRGRSAWLIFQRRLKAQGVELNWHTLAPPPVADEENFATTPFLAALFDFVPGTHSPRDAVAYNQTAGFAQIGEPFLEQRRTGDQVPAIFNSRRTDLTAGLRILQKDEGQSNADAAGSAAGILSALGKFEGVLDQLREASRRPKSRFNLSYNEDTTWRMPQPHLAVLRRVGVILTLRASAQLSLGRSGPAADDARLILALANSVRDEPFPGSHSTRHALLVQARQIVWEGLADHRWSEAQLQDFQSCFNQLNLIREARPSLELERSSIDQLFGQLRRQPGMVAGWRFGPGIGSAITPYFLWLMPGGWLDRERISYHQLFQERLGPVFYSGRGGISPGLIHGAVPTASAWWNHRLLADAFLPSAENQLKEAAIAQTGRDQTILACGLEQFRLRHGEFPATLDALVPQFLSSLPPDAIGGRVMKYHRTANGHYQLYSIGWNETDDGGKVTRNPGGSLPDFNQGDWVWPPYPDQ